MTVLWFWERRASEFGVINVQSCVGVAISPYDHEPYMSRRENSHVILVRFSPIRRPVGNPMDLNDHLGQSTYHQFFRPHSFTNDRASTSLYDKLKRLHMGFLWKVRREERRFYKHWIPAYFQVVCFFPLSSCHGCKCHGCKSRTTSTYLKHTGISV